MAFFVRKRPVPPKEESGRENVHDAAHEHARVTDEALLANIVHKTTADARMSLPGRRGSVVSAQSVEGAAFGNTRLFDEQGTGPADNRAGRADRNASLQGSDGAKSKTDEAQAKSEQEAPKRPGLLTRLKNRLRAFLYLVLGLFFFLLSLFAVYKFSLWLYSWMHTSPMFVTRHIDITGNVRLQRDMILHLGGLSEGDNAFSVSIAAVEHRLRQTPWVEDVSVKRILPDRFVIRLQERMPSFWIRREGRLFYANEKGELIAPVESSNFMSLPILSIEPGCEDAIPYLSRLMRDIRSGILPVEAGAIATVDVSPSRGVELYLEDREMRLSLAPDDWDGNLLRLGATIGDLARRRELSSVQEVRASQNSVWVVLRRPVEQQ